MAENKAVPIPVSYERLNAQPLDITDVFTSEDSLQRYLISGACYAGQFVALATSNGTIPYLIADNNGYKILIRLSTSDDVKDNTSGTTYIPLTFVDEDPNYFETNSNYITYTKLEDWLNNGWLELANCGLTNTDTGKLYSNRWIVIVKAVANSVGTMEYTAMTQPFSVSQQGYSLAEKKTVTKNIRLNYGFNAFAVTECNIVYACDYTRQELYKSTDYGLTFSKLETAISSNEIITTKDGKYVYVVYNNKLYYSSDYGATFTIKFNDTACGAIHMSKDGKYVYILTQEAHTYQYSSDYGSTFKKIICNNVYNAFSTGITAISGDGNSISINSSSVGVDVSFDYGRTFRKSTYNYSNMTSDKTPSGVNYPVVYDIFSMNGDMLFLFDEYDFSLKMIDSNNVPAILSNARKSSPFYDKSKHLNETYRGMALIGYVDSLDRIYYVVQTQATAGNNVYICYYDIKRGLFKEIYSYPGVEIDKTATTRASANGFMTLVYYDGQYSNGNPNMSFITIRPMNYVLDYIKDGTLYQLPLVGGNGIFITKKSDGDLEYLEISTDANGGSSNTGSGDAPYQFIREGYLEKTVSQVYPDKLVYVLSKRPYPDTISVFMNGVYIPPKNSDGSVNYTTDLNYLVLNTSLLYYDSATASGQSMAVETDDQIDVTYFVAESMSGGSGGTVSGSTPTIDPITKHWMIDGIDTGVVAEGRSNLLRIKSITTSNVVFDNDHEAYYLENPTSNVNFTLGLDSNVDKTEKILSFELHLKLDKVRTITFPAATKWVSDIPSTSLAAGYYYVFIFRTHDGGTTWTGNLAYKFPISAVVNQNFTDSILLTFTCDYAKFGGYVNIVDSNGTIVQTMYPSSGVKCIYSKQFNFANGVYEIDYSHLTTLKDGGTVYKHVTDLYNILYYINGQGQVIGSDFIVDTTTKTMVLNGATGNKTHDIAIKVIPVANSPLDGAIMI